MDGGTHIPPLAELLGEERWLQALARRLVRDAATADDLVQETWFRALRARGAGGRGGVDDARAWLGRVLRNVWRERGRSERARGRREARAAAPEALPSARESLERVELAQRLATLVLELDEPYRSIVVWRYYENRSAAAIAAELGEPAARVRWRLMRARELLRQRLARERGDWAARYALFLPLARRAPAPAGAAAGGAAGIGVLTMATKTLLWVGAAAVLAWTLVRAASRPSEPSSVSPVLVEPAPVAEPAAEPGLRAPAGEAERTSLPPTASPAPAAGAARAGDPFARLRGRVRAAEDGRALADAEVALFEPDGGSLRARTRTASDGTFRLEGLAPGAFDVACRLDGRQPRRVPAPELVAGHESELALELELGFPVAVQVLEHPSGAPLEAAAVELVPGDRASVVWLRPDALAFRALRGVTGPDGRAELGGGARGVYQYVVRAPGHAAALGEALLEPEAATLRIEVQRGGVVHGSVLHPGGAPAEGARVFLNPVEHVRGLSRLVFRQNGLAADRDGRYRLEGVPPGVYHAVALMPDGSGVFGFDPEHEDPRALARIVVEDATEVPLDFRLPVPGHVRGRVLDPDGAPIAGARVYVSWGDFKPGRAGFFALAEVAGVKESIHHSTRSDAAGVFELANLRLSHEPLELNVSARGFVEGELELDVPEGARLEPVITLRALGPTISGRLTDARGEPIAGQGVGCFESDGTRLGAFFQAQSGPDGRYELRVASTAGALHRVQPIVRDSSPYRCEPELSEGVPAGAREVDFVLHPRRTLAGLVVDDAGTAVRDFVVHALESGPEPSWEECDDANRGEGRFELYLDASEVAQLRFSAPGCDPAALTDLAGGGERRVVLRRAADLEGVLRDAAGRGVAGAVVALATLDSAIYPRGTGFAPRATTDAEGRFRLRGVPDPSLPGAPPAAAGHLLVCPRREDAPALVRFALPVPRPALLELVLPRSVPVELAFTDARGRPLEGGVFVLDAAGWPNEPAAETHLADQASPTRGVLVDGRARLRLLPGAHHAILVLGSEAREAFPFEVADPGPGEAELQTHAFTAGAR